MKRKSKLAGSRYFIEHDLSYEDRKTQEEIHKWIKLMRGEGLEVKAGARRVLVNNVWVQWDNKIKLEDMVSAAVQKIKDRVNKSKEGGKEDKNKNENENLQ